MESQTIKVNIKWGKKMLEGVEIDMGQDIMTFKCQVYSQTFVPVEKQKIMAKGKMIKEDMEWKDYPAVKDGAVLMLMGTAEGNELKAPEKEMKFVEDMTPEQIAQELKERTGVSISAGLENLGNTCYMNSVMQSLKRVNELREALANFELDDQNSGLRNDPNVALT
jgi:ubiquitin carboxyl-terminal hydrolase 14